MRLSLAALSLVACASSRPAANPPPKTSSSDASVIDSSFDASRVTPRAAPSLASTDASTAPLLDAATSNAATSDAAGWTTLGTGVRLRQLHCSVHIGSGTTTRGLNFRQVRVESSGGAQLMFAANPFALEPDPTCQRGYAAGSPAAFLEWLHGKGVHAVAAVNGSLFFRAPVNTPPVWWPEGLVWSPPLTNTPLPADTPLRFNECRSDRAEIAIITGDAGLQILRVGLEPCPATHPQVRSVPEWRGQWCGAQTPGPARWGYEHKEACARVDATSLQTLPATVREQWFQGAPTQTVLLTSQELIDKIRAAFPHATAIAQVTGPWPSFNQGTLQADGALRGTDIVCANEAPSDTRNMYLPAIRGIMTAICRPLPRTFLCGHANGDISLVVTPASSLEDIARAMRDEQGCDLHCVNAINLDGGGSTQIGWRTRNGTSDAWGVNQPGTCGPYRSPANFVTVTLPNQTVSPPADR